MSLQEIMVLFTVQEVHVKSCVCVYLLRKEFPNALSFLKGFLGSTTRAFPGTMPSFSPCITAMNPSVVGSGPIRIPGKSCSSRYLHTETETHQAEVFTSSSAPWTSHTHRSRKGRKRWTTAAGILTRLTSCCSV